MPTIRVMFIGQGPSGLAEDRVVNTFHFDGTPVGPADPSDIELCLNWVQAFYMDARSPGGPNEQTQAIASFLSPWVQNAAELRAYDLLEPGAGPPTTIPRTPTIRTLNLAGFTRSSGLPEEVALCLSYNGAGPSTPRRRGRIYLGPLTGACSTSTTGSDSTHPTGTIQHNLCMAGKQLSEVTPASLRWCIKSSMPTTNYVPIVRGYVDNAFDTQIRRGPTTTSRETWVQVVGL